MKVTKHLVAIAWISSALLSACASDSTRPQWPAANDGGGNAMEGEAYLPPGGQANGSSKGTRYAPLSFEAERAAIAKGCTTANGVRPAALLTEKTGAVEVYEVGCRQQRMTVRCAYRNCQAAD